MLRQNRFIRFALAMAVACSAALQTLQVRGQDLVASETLSGGGSAFVFREPLKKPQSKMAGGYAFLGRDGGGSRGRRPHVNAQIASAAKKRRAAAAARRRAAQAAANRKIQLSNTLTVKAEALFDKDESDDAISTFREALVQNPKNTRATGGLAEALTAAALSPAVRSRCPQWYGSPTVCVRRPCTVCGFIRLVTSTRASIADRVV